MKVVLFCGGLGMRLRDYSDTVPKPMVKVGDKPILLHVMKYYSHYGHKEFILCLGYKGDEIKRFFLDYNESLSNDFTLTNGGRDVKLLTSDIQDWHITFVDTGLTSNIGQRLKAVEKYLGEDEVFLANYTDGLINAPLPKLIDAFYKKDKVASFMSVRPALTFHIVSAQEDGLVESLQDVGCYGMWINGGYFIFKREIFKYINPGEELVHEPFRRLINEKQLTTHQHQGFFACMDTFKEKQMLDDMHARGEMPWAVWRG